MTDLLILGACAIVYFGVAAGIGVVWEEKAGEPIFLIPMIWPIALPICAVAWLVAKGVRWVLR